MCRVISDVKLHVLALAATGFGEDDREVSSAFGKVRLCKNCFWERKPAFAIGSLDQDALAQPLFRGRHNVN